MYVDAENVPALLVRSSSSADLFRLPLRLTVIPRSIAVLS
jgi:hypothetical protein